MMTSGILLVGEVMVNPRNGLDSTARLHGKGGGEGHCGSAADKLGAEILTVIWPRKTVINGG